MPLLRGSGFKVRNFGGMFLGKEVKKPFFACGGQGWCIISDKKEDSATYYTKRDILCLKFYAELYDHC